MALISEDDKRLEYAEIASLETIHAWQVLAGKLKEREDVELSAIKYAIMDGTLDIREVDRIRGFIQGLRWAQNAPAVAAKRHREMTKGT